MSYIYLIRCIGTNYVKIGFSHKPELRLEHLQIGCPMKLEMICPSEGSRRVTPPALFLLETFLRPVSTFSGGRRMQPSHSPAIRLFTFPSVRLFPGDVITQTLNG